MQKEGKVVIFCAPSGTGKTTITKRMMALFPELAFSISATTRAPRDGERDGIDYHFVTKERFDEMVAAGQFLEWEAFYGRQYGTLKSEVERLVAAGKVPVFDIEVLGAWNIKQFYGDRALMVFIKAPTDVIIQRLFGLSDLDLLIAPNWQLKKSEIQYYIDQRILERGVVQGSQYRP